MSGHKRATILLQQADQARFAQASRHLKIVEQDYDEIKAKICQVQTEYLHSSLDTIQTRQNNYSNSLAHLGSQLSQVELVLSQKIIDCTSQIYEEINSLGIETWQNTADLIDQQSQALQDMCSEAVSHQQLALDQVQQQLRTQSDRRLNQRQIAVSAFQDAVAFMNSLQNSYDLERFYPGITNTMANELDLAQKNIENDFFEAGLAISQQIYLRCSTARLEIENYFLQHSIFCSAALNKGFEILGMYDAQSQVNAVDLQGNPLDLEIDVDHWSWGKWREKRSCCLRLVHRLKRSSENLEIEEIDDILKQMLDCDEALPEIVSQARENILASQIRYNLAECIVASLQEQGFFLENSTYEYADQRQPYQTTLQNLEGSRIIVKLSPQSGESLIQNIDLVSEDNETRTAYELHQRVKKLRSALQSFGLQVNFTQVKEPDSISAGTHDPARIKNFSDSRPSEKIIKREPAMRN